MEHSGPISPTFYVAHILLNYVKKRPGYIFDSYTILIPLISYKIDCCPFSWALTQVKERVWAFLYYYSLFFTGIIVPNRILSKIGNKKPHIVQALPHAGVLWSQYKEGQVNPMGMHRSQKHNTFSITKHNSNHPIHKILLQPIKTSTTSSTSTQFESCSIKTQPSNQENTAGFEVFSVETEPLATK